MKWCQLYSRLLLHKPSNQPNNDSESFFKRMIEKEQFYLSPFHVHLEGPDVNEPDEVRFYPDDENLPVRATISQAILASGGLQLCCKLIGILPPGFRHGTYLLMFNSDLECTTLPVDMFEDEVIPKEEYDHWHTMDGQRGLPRDN